MSDSMAMRRYICYDVMRELRLIADHGGWDEFLSHLEWLEAEGREVLDARSAPDDQAG